MGDRAKRREELLPLDRLRGSFLPGPNEGGGSCQRKWGHIKEGRKGQGQVRRGHRPGLAACKPAPPRAGGQRPRGRGPGPRKGSEALRLLQSPPIATGVSVWGGAALLTTAALLPCSLPAVVGVSLWHPTMSGYLVTGGAPAWCVLGDTSGGSGGKDQGEMPWGHATCAWREVTTVTTLSRVR